MGCINSKKELTDTNPNLFRVVNVDDDGIPLWSGQLGITRTELTLYRKGREPTRWPLACLRRYGYETDLFTFESGRRCATGEGIYAFRCRRADNLFQTLQNYIQLPIATDTASDGHESYPIPLTSNGPLVLPRTRNSIQMSSVHAAGATFGTYVINNNRPASQNLSPSGTIQSSSNRSRSSDTINGESNYLQPTPNRPSLISRFNVGLRLGSVSSGPLSSDPQSPGSPNSITNILEVTTLNPLPSGNPGISNVYQEFPIRENCQNMLNNNVKSLSSSYTPNNSTINNDKKLSLDIPPHEPAPSLQNNKTINPLTSALLNTNFEPMETIKQQQQPTPLSPLTTGMAHSDSMDSSHMYMNITPGEMPLNNNNKTLHPTISNAGGNETPQSAQTPTTSVAMFALSRINSTFSIDPNRCYENLESLELRPKQNRVSKPDVYAKIDLPQSDISEPSTPVTRRCNYITLDLDQVLTVTTAPPLTNQSTNNSINSNIASTVCSSSIKINGAIPSSTIASSVSFGLNPNSSSGNFIPIGLLPPESPKKGILDYATIDFNKTVALSNSTTPSSELDCEGSRQTRHSSTILMGKHSNSISD